MNKSDHFTKYNAEDLEYEFEMLNQCKVGIISYQDPFLHNLCLEGWLLHARRIIEAFRLESIDNEWKKIWGLISEHLSHANASNRVDQREEKRLNPVWNIESYHFKMIEDIGKVATQYKEYINYGLLLKILDNIKK